MAIKTKRHFYGERQNSGASHAGRRRQSARPAINLDNGHQLTPNPDLLEIQVGDVVKIVHARETTAKTAMTENLGVIISCNGHSCEVFLWQGKATIPKTHLKKIETSKEERVKLYNILRRMYRLHQKLDPQAKEASVLQQLGKSLILGLTEADKLLLNKLEYSVGNLRRHRRVSFLFDVEYHTADNPAKTFKGQCTNLSPQGIFITKGEEFHLQGLLVLYLFPSRYKKGFQCQVEIVREDDLGYGCLFL